jgi:hypothetical protein
LNTLWYLKFKSKIASLIVVEEYVTVTKADDVDLRV